MEKSLVMDLSPDSISPFMNREVCSRTSLGTIPFDGVIDSNLTSRGQPRSLRFEGYKFYATANTLRTSPLVRRPLRHRTKIRLLAEGRLLDEASPNPVVLMSSH